MRTVFRRSVFLAGLLALTGVTAARAQDSVRVVPGWGIDTSHTGSGDYTSQGPVPEIYRAWSEYLRTDGAQFRSPTKYWLASEQRKWLRYDIAGSFAYQGFPASVLSIQHAGTADSAVYVVRTLFASALGPKRDIKPMALTRVYAVREAGRWVFANALPYLTKDWKRYKVGSINYIVQPGHRFDPIKARRAASFADSVARLFGVPPGATLTYFVTDTSEEVHRILGLDFFSLGEQASYGDPAKAMVLVGNPVFGEAHLHELTHVVLGPLLALRKTPGVMNEGVATWLGGSLGKPFDGVMREYAAFLTSHPAITLDSVLTASEHDLGTRPAGAALVDLAYKRGGIAAVKVLMNGGESIEQLRAAAVNAFNKPWADIENAWRAHILEFALPGSRALFPRGH